MSLMSLGSAHSIAIVALATTISKSKSSYNTMSTITECFITGMPESLFDPMPQVWVVIDGKTRKLFDYYPDEISFNAKEFIGLTAIQALELYHKKDKAYLQS